MTQDNHHDRRRKHMAHMDDKKGQALTAPKEIWVAKLDHLDASQSTAFTTAMLPVGSGCAPWPEEIAKRVKYTRADLTQAAIAAAMMGAVKPLEWGHSNGGYLIASAFGLAVAYKISGVSGNWTLLRTGATSYITDEGFETQSAAKAAAEADYQARILSALSIPTDAIAALEAMLTEAEQRGFDRAMKGGV